MKSYQPKQGPPGDRTVIRTSTATRLRSSATLFYLLLCLNLAYSASASAQSQNDYDRLEQVSDLIRQGQLTNAEAELDAIMRRRPGEPNALNFLGVIRAQQKRASEAEQLFLRALKSSPTLVGAYVNLGHLYLASRSLDRALWAFTEAGKLAPGRDEITFNLAAIHVERREFESALLILDKNARSSFAVEEFRLRVKSYLGLRRTKEAIAIIPSLTQPSVVGPEDAANFAALFAEHNLLDEAVEILEAARKRFPGAYPLLYNLGASYFQKQDLTRAEDFLTAALAAKPDDVAALRALARVARARGETEKALAHLLRARKIEPDSPPLLYEFGWAALNQKLLYDAFKAFDYLHRMKPDEPSYLYSLAVVRLLNGEAEIAQSLITRFIELRPQDARGHYILGVIFYTLQQLTKARAALERSLTLTHYPDTDYYLGMIADSEGDAAQSAALLQRALEKDPSHAAAHTALGTAYAKQKRFQAARAELELAIELEPKDTKAHYQLGLVYARLGEKERSRKMFAMSEKLRVEERENGVVGLRLIDLQQ